MVKKIRHLNIAIVFMLLLQLVLYPANTLGNDKVNITVEQAVQLVKDNFTIPEKYSRLSTGYNEYNNREIYSLNWNGIEQPGGSFHVQVDAITGDILNVNQWEQVLKPSFKLPVLSKGDAEKIAADLVSKLASKHQSEMQLEKDKQQISSLNNSQPFTYNFRWIRIVNGIPFPGNGINVSISGEDGRVINYNYNWTQDLVFPAALNVISPEKASQAFTDASMLELQYFLPPIMDPQTPEPQRVLLVYQLTNKYYGGAVDALSGKPVTLDTQLATYQSVSAVSSVAVTKSVSTSAATSKVISNEKVSPVQESPSQDVQEDSQQISQKEAVDIVKKMVTIPKGLVQRNSNLTPDWQNPSEQVWDLQWNSQAYSPAEHRYFSARVNAKTGDLVGLNQFSGVNPNDQSKPLTRSCPKNSG